MKYREVQKYRKDFQPGKYMTKYLTIAISVRSVGQHSKVSHQYIKVKTLHDPSQDVVIAQMSWILDFSVQQKKFRY